jgi:glycosyltransferase involved in cell wall biosynthesis
MIAFQNQGHQVFLLTHAQEGDLHTDVKKHGVKTFTHQVKKHSSVLFYAKHIFFLASFTKKHKINIVYSHIQLANIIAAFVQFFSPARFILCRHHSDCAYVDNNRTEKLFDRIINWLGKEFIVPSRKVLAQMTDIENAKNKKIHLIRYAYDFSGYSMPDENEINKIKENYKTKLLLVKVARLIPEKRHILLFRAVNRLIKENYDVKLLVLSEGKERENMEKYIHTNSLHNNIFLLGYRTDIMNYIGASDLVVHVSESEASSNLIKEAGLCEKPVVVCKDVGDFDEYIENSINGFILSKENTEEEVYALLKKIYNKEIDISSIGKELNKTVHSLFYIGSIIHQYDRINAPRANE